jgi:ABC-type amino acid transport system permease subunit
MSELLLDFLPRFAAALGVNIGIAAWAVLGGLLLGLPLAAARLLPGLSGRAAALLIALLRAAPTFVVMFFLLNALPHGLSLGPLALAMTPWLAVVLSLAVYATAYVSDNALDALQQWRLGERLAAVLFPMGLLRAFFVMVLSSGFGAAVGVVEATTVTLRQIEALEDNGQRLALMGVVVALYVLLFQSLYLLIDRLRARLLRRLSSA